VTTQVSTAHRVPGDHLGEVAWAPLDDLDRFDLIPNMRPVIREFCATNRMAGAPGYVR